jgi:hypothetical protein
MSNQLEITDKLIDQLQKAAMPREVTVDGKNYVGGGAVSLPPLPYSATAISVHSLSALAEYVNNAEPDIPPGHDAPLLVVIQSPTTVVVDEWLDENRQRERLLVATAITPNFPFGQYRNVEDFIIMPQTQFAETEHVAPIIKLVSSLSDETVISFKDDGITQQVNARVGIAREADVTVPRIVTLCPYRTFKDVDRQPESTFLLRLKREEGKPPQAALFEADGGMWQVTAIDFIKSYLEAQIEKDTDDKARAVIIG